MTAWERLTVVLPEEQREQLAELLARRLGQGWGTLEIDIREHKIQEFREVVRTPARKQSAGITVITT